MSTSRRLVTCGPPRHSASRVGRAERDAGPLHLRGRGADGGTPRRGRREAGAEWYAPVHHTRHHDVRARVVNPITVAGTILAASATGQPVAATTYGEWIAPVMLRQTFVPLPYSLCNLLSYLFPAPAQAFHVCQFEPAAATLLSNLSKSVKWAPKPPVKCQNERSAPTPLLSNRSN